MSTTNENTEITEVSQLGDSDEIVSDEDTNTTILDQENQGNDDNDNLIGSLMSRIKCLETSLEAKSRELKDKDDRMYALINDKTVVSNKNAETSQASAGIVTLPSQSNASQLIHTNIPTSHSASCSQPLEFLNKFLSSNSQTIIPPPSKPSFSHAINKPPSLPTYSLPTYSQPSLPPYSQPPSLPPYSQLPSLPPYFQPPSLPPYSQPPSFSTYSQPQFSNFRNQPPLVDTFATRPQPPSFCTSLNKPSQSLFTNNYYSNYKQNTNEFRSTFNPTPSINAIRTTAVECSTSSYSHPNQQDESQCFQNENIHSVPVTISNSYNPTTSGLFNSGYQFKRKLYDLPEFAGKPEEWPVFVTTFRESTAAFNYTNLENIFRLQKSLKASARESVESLLIHPNNIPQIIEQLEFSYGRPDCLIRSQIAKVKEIFPITESRIEQIVPFATKVQNLAVFLETTNSFEHMSNPTLMDELISKLPVGKRLEWAQYAMQIRPFPTVLDFSKWLHQIARLITLVTLPNPSSNTNARQYNQSFDRKSKNKNVLLHAKEQHQPPKIKSGITNSCDYCEKTNHKIANCYAFHKLSLKERWDIVKNKHLCFSCLLKNHSVKDCKNKKACDKDGCKRMHHQSLHETVASAPEMIISQGNSSQDNNQNTVLSCQEPDTKLLFRVLPVKLYGPASIVETYAFFDEGSSLTILDEDVALQLGLGGEKIDLELQWIGNKTSIEKSNLVNLEISGIGNYNQKYNLKNVRTMKNLALPSQTLDLKQLNTKYHCIKNIPIVEFAGANPKILIGIDNAHLGSSGRVIRKSSSDPIVAKSKLGWVVYGPIQSNISATSISNNANVVLRTTNEFQPDDLHDIVEQYFTTENFGVKRPEKTLESMKDARANKLLKETTKRIIDRFQTGLLWKSDDVVLPNNFQMALNRLQNTERKILKSKILTETYERNLMEYVQKGYARKLSDSEIKSSNGRTWYLPHFGVQNPNKPNKVRIVFDAAASVGGKSLNSCLLKGPDQNKPLPTILFQFREGAVAVVGDIKEMFSQVKIIPDDINSQRFLWRHCDQSKPVEIYVMTSMIFGSTCSPCSAQHVKNINAREYSKEYPKAVDAILNHHYVDDYVQSFADEAEAIEVALAVKNIHLKACFELTKFVSNSEAVLKALNNGKDSNQSKSILNMEVDNEFSVDKILGMCWDVKKDEFMFQLKFHRIDKNVLIGNRRPTKREMLAIIMSIFDPFGFLADYVIYSKILLQQLWKIGLHWDEKLPDDINDKWIKWFEGLQSVKNIRIKRCYSVLLPKADRVELHIFVDASELAFAAVAYLRILVGSTVELSFIVGKTRCAPQKLLSVPRLELQAAVLGVRLKNMVVENHGMNIEKFVFWSDSKTVLSWIKSDHRKYKPFVAHRVSEILDDSKVSNWLWVPSKQNPADKATRVKFRPQCEEESVWLKGPKYLLSSENYENTFPCEVVQNCNEEIRHTYGCNVVTQKMKIINLDRFSKYLSVKRALAWVNRFLNNVSAKKKNGERKSGELSADEIKAADLMLCRMVQQDVYNDEIQTLTAKNVVDKCSSIFKLTPLLDEDGIVRLGGRINAAFCVDEHTKCPIILPKNHKLTTMIINEYHRKLHHQNNETIVSEIRKRYWIPNLRSAVGKTKKECQKCKIDNAKPMTPLMGQLPMDRLTPYVRPFAYTGLDYFGPYHVTIGRRREKRWVALFTCLTVRAVHLELSADLSADACILCIRNFISLRGAPIRIRSDNGTNFIAANKELKEIQSLFENEKNQQELSSRGIEWIFNCPSNPSAGGCWERLVKSVKRVLTYTLHEEAPRVETLRSLLLEAANIVNSRPLAHVPVSSEEEEPLTPNHLLIGESNCPSILVDPDTPKYSLRKQWRVAQQFKNKFWKRWISEYLPTLTRRTKYFKKMDPIKKGDLVIIWENEQTRGQWRRGKVVDVHVGSDGEIRTAAVKTSNGILRRPVSKLAILDVEKSSESLGTMSIHGGRDVAEALSVTH